MKGDRGHILPVVSVKAIVHTTKYLHTNKARIHLFFLNCVESSGKCLTVFKVSSVNTMTMPVCPAAVVVVV